MLDHPWDLVLTFVFILTGVHHGASLLRGRRGQAVGAVRRRPELRGEDLVDINHMVMSLAMILMIWVTLGDVAIWVQVVLFGVLGASLLPTLRRGAAPIEKVDVVGHVMLDAAMMWMLAAMPLLMTGMENMGAEGGAHADHAGHSAGVMSMPMQTPGWAEAVNSGFVLLCAAGALWWAWRGATAPRHHRLHLLRHAMMSAGMGLMLVLMNT